MSGKEGDEKNFKKLKGKTNPIKGGVLRVIKNLL